MAIAYINKDNKVLHIVLSDEERIQPSEDGKMYMTVGEYDYKKLKFNHVFGVGEEVREVPAHGLGIGSIYQEPEIVTSSPVEILPEEIELESKEQQREQLIKDLTSQYVYQSKDFQDWLNKQLEEALAAMNETLDPDENTDNELENNIGEINE